MAVIDDAERARVVTREVRIAVVRSGAPGIAVERRVRLDVDLEVEAGLSCVLLDDGGKVGNLTEVTTLDGSGEIGDAGVGNELLGLVDVAGALRCGIRIEERKRRQDRVIVGDLGPPGEQRVHHLVAIEGPAQCLANEVAVPLALRDVEPDLTVVRRRRGENRERVVVEEALTADDAEVLDDIDFAA